MLSLECSGGSKREKEEFTYVCAVYIDYICIVHINTYVHICTHTLNVCVYMYIPICIYSLGWASHTTNSSWTAVTP